MNRGTRSFVSLLAILGWTFVGCAPAPAPPAPAPATNAGHGHEHGHGHGHEHPKTFAEAVQQIEGLRKAIAEAFAANDLEKADGPVHEIGHLLEDAEALAKKENVADEAVKKALGDLFEAFGQIDGKIHGKPDGKTYAEVAPALEAAMDVIRSKPGEK